MITIGMWVGFFLGMYLTSSLVGYTVCGIVGIWLGAWIGTACSDSKEDARLVNNKEAVRLTIVFALALVVRLISDAIFSNIVALIIHLAAIMIFDNWHRITKGAFNWKQMSCIGGGVLLGIHIAYQFGVPAWLGFFIPIGGAILGSIVYNKYFHSSIRDDEKEIFFYLSLYGKIAAMDGGVAPEEEEYFRSRFVNPDPHTKDDRDANEFVLNSFHEAAKTASDWNTYLAGFVKTVYLNQSEALDDYILDLCFFSLLRGHGEISQKKLDALYQIATEFDIPIVFLDRLIAELIGNFKGADSPFQSQTYTSNSIDDFYAILGCDRNATYEEVKRAYRMKSKLNHPDKVKSFGFDDAAVENATRKMQQINEAYDAIKRYHNW